ncbi:hypothetical protein Igag_0607 [Ignisphaera aggregans DSM 17230]|uniref:Uncharacterized protein n=1 Tax=Ignisphaera aggregans (strain DSM 17230 / JCM 13409 / AQ1.S1) TaxID=583356 RepID=E0SSG9_IGNAA|nr:hypothetical protein Igag_0607 [Ignisphaera aggregans DSM 17230]
MVLLWSCLSNKFLEFIEICISDFGEIPMVLKERIGYIHEVSRDRIGRIYPKDEVSVYNYKSEAKKK